MMGEVATPILANAHLILQPPAQIVAALEQTKAESSVDFVDRHGDWGREAALWLGRRTGRMSLAELGKAAGG